MWALSIYIHRNLTKISTANEAGETPLDIAKRLQHSRCEELVRNIADLLLGFWNKSRSIRLYTHPFVVCLSVFLIVGSFQLTQVQTGKFNAHVHVEYEWCLQNDDLDESEDELEDKVGSFHRKHFVAL